MNIASNFLNLRDRVTIDIAISPQLDGYSYTVIPAGLIVSLGSQKVEQKQKWTMKKWQLFRVYRGWNATHLF